MVQQQDFTRITNDVNGNPRYILHFLKLLTQEESKNCYSIMEQLHKATTRAKQIGGKTYRGKDYGGGIVFQSYNLQDTCDRINNIVTPVCQ